MVLALDERDELSLYGNNVLHDVGERMKTIMRPLHPPPLLRHPPLLE